MHRVVVEKKDDDQLEMFNVNETFGNALDHDELEKAKAYYQHSDGWTNRLIQGDSLLTMTSLLEREGMAERVQMIYIDPPYGISYKSNWQVKLGDRNVKDGSDDHLSGEPEMIKAFRDTWELGIHSYLSYLRERLLVAKELLTASGSCFVQINDENVHLVRSLMDEVFGSDCFKVTICFQKKAYQDAGSLAPVNDYIVWYSRNKAPFTYRPLYNISEFDGDYGKYTRIVSTKGEVKKCSSFSPEELQTMINTGWRMFREDYPLVSQDPSKIDQVFPYQGKDYRPTPGRHWSVKYPEGLDRLAELGRIRATVNRLYGVVYWDENALVPMSNFWSRMKGAADPVYVVQTSSEVVKRCMLMSTDPGDLILDPTCGSGTTAHVAEQWGRRWITIDTSRIALNVAKTRLMTATFPYYHLHSDVDVQTEVKEGKIKKNITEKKYTASDVRQGFVYNEIAQVTLENLANDETPKTYQLIDQPIPDNKRLRVSGPFTVETLQDFEPVSPADLQQRARSGADDVPFEQRIYAHLESAGVLTGKKGEKAIFTRVDRRASAYLHGEGFYTSKAGEKKAYFHIGPKFGTVSRQAVNAAIKECRQRGDADWLVILGFSFETDIETQEVTMSAGSFMVTKTRMHDDLMQDGLMKKPKNVGSFITIGEPDVRLVDMPKVKGEKTKGKADERMVQVEIAGLDIYDPISDTVKARNVEDIAYWMVDDDYDGTNFVVKQVFFCGSDKQVEFKKWQKGLSDLAKRSTKKKAEQTLKIEIDDEAFDRLYGHISHPIAVKKGQKLAVRVISLFGEESTKVLLV